PAAPLVAARPAQPDGAPGQGRAALPPEHGRRRRALSAEALSSAPFFGRRRRAPYSGRAIDRESRAPTLDSPPRWIAPLVSPPALQWRFPRWDDHRTFLNNPGYRGLGWAQVRWAFTNTVMGHWIPVTWLTFSIDHALWGMNASGYHLTNIVLHAVAAVLVYF